MQLEAKIDIAIARPAKDVFEAIVDPTKMSRYFISRASGRPEPGKILTWTWDDVGAEAQVKILDVVPEHRLVFTWGVAEQETRVTIEMETDGPGTTAVTVTEGSWEPEREKDGLYGNAYTTALASIALSVPFQLIPIFQR